MEKMKVTINNELPVFGRYYQNGRIEINLDLCIKENQAISDVIKHEYIHYLSMLNKCKNEEHLIRVIVDNWVGIEKFSRKQSSLILAQTDEI